jgi:pyruvate formate lyase activating enzyme
MKLSGLQKLTLLDYPGTMACTVFTKGCNFRCPFCHNAPLVLSGSPEPDISESELLDFLKKRVGVLEGVVFTGGEPLLHSDVPSLFKKIKSLGFKIKLDTNGSKPELLEEIVSEGLIDRVAMDIKNSPDGYFKAIGTDCIKFSDIERSKNFIMSSNIDYEFRTTVVKGIHTKDDLIQLAKWIQGAKEYYLQQFKDSGNLINAVGLSPFTAEEMKNFANDIRPFVQSVSVRGI